MRRGEQLATLRQIVAIREAQALAAEAKATRAAAARRDLEALRQDCLDDLAQGQAQWSRALCGSAVSLPLATAWSGAIHEHYGKLQTVDRRITQAALHAQQLAQAWRIARDRVEIVQDQVRSSVKSVSRAKDEAVLNDITELCASRRFRP